MELVFGALCALAITVTVEILISSPIRTGRNGANALVAKGLVLVAVLAGGVTLAFVTNLPVVMVGVGVGLARIVSSVCRHRSVRARA